ncbi:MAG: hypothetical protein K6C36_01275 [Clostridia bacterium]|nr:hypothetical protein [Clostridia bacterium]
MKKIVSIAAVFCLLAALCGCSKDSEAEPSDGVKTSQVMVTVLDATEYLLYQNIFMNDQADEYAGLDVTKRGTYASIEDKFNGKTRYYVWGYYDNTKCCDWQWEFVPTDISSLPEPGSLVEVTGLFEYSDDALDKYWINGASVKVDTKYVGGAAAEVDMTKMSATLERVQLVNVQQYAQDFDGKTVALYGRIASPSSVQHPYYDGSWTQDFSCSGTAPATGVTVVVSGKYTSGRLIDNAEIEVTNQF